MDTENSRIQVSLDTETNSLLSRLAKKNNKSLSATAARLIKQALELEEDAMLSQHADERLANTKAWHTHQDAWGK